MELRKERCCTVGLSTGNYRVFPESVVYSVQIDIMYWITGKRLGDPIRAIINKALNRIQPTQNECETLARYAREAEKLYNALPEDKKATADREGAKAYTRLQYV